MGIDIVPATVLNSTDPSASIFLLVVNGDIMDSQWPPKSGDFAWVAAGIKSDSVYRSIDAFGTYYADSSPALVIFGGKASSWWKIPDGLDVVVAPDGSGNLQMTIANRFIFCNHNPETSTPDDWNVNFCPVPPSS